MVMDEEIKRLIERKAMELAFRAVERKPAIKPQAVLSDEDVIRELKMIVKGERASEIIEGAYALYGKAAVEVFRRLVEMFRQGRVKEFWDHELYMLLENLGLRVPLKTRVRIVRHGREERIGENLTSQD